MVCLTARADLALLHFNEVADVHILVQNAIRTNAREGADGIAWTDL
jgi:hypothetical protein